MYDRWWLIYLHWFIGKNRVLSTLSRLYAINSFVCDDLCYIVYEIAGKIYPGKCSEDRNN